MTNKLVSKRELEISLTMRPVWELKDLFNLIDRMPLVDGGFTRHGHWIEEPIEDEWGKLPSIWHCSECDNLELNYSPYCPNCGAKMDEDKIDRVKVLENEEDKGHAAGGRG